MTRTKADKWFSEFIRLRYADEYGLVECYTCGKRDYWRNMDCGHYLKRQYKSTRFSEINCQVQCKKCNYFLQGNDIKFRERLIQEYGETKIKMMESGIKGIYKVPKYEIEAITEIYKKKVYELTKNLKIR